MTTQCIALDTYFQRLPVVLDKIEALRQLADDHFGNDPDAIHWGHVRDLERVDQALDDPHWPALNGLSAPLAHSGGCEPQNPANLVFYGSTSAPTRRPNREQRRVWPRKWPILGVLAAGHPQHRWPEPRMARGFRARKRARRSSEPL